MQTADTARPLSPASRACALRDYCGEILAPLSRTDQRRWGEVYIRGLLELEGRKTLARISEHVLGERAVQPLQQFLNQSPWDATRVRRELAHRVTSQLKPVAWAVDEVVFPKHGERSAGVARQFASTLGRTANCQLAMATSLLGEAGGVPVNWRLMLPPHWDDDHGLRRGAHVPDEECHRPRWQHVLEAADEMAEEWDLAPMPLLLDWRHEPSVENLLMGLEGRGLGYIIQLAPSAQVVPPHLRPRTMAGTPGSRQQPVSAHELIALAEQRGGRSTQCWHDPAGQRMRRSQFLTAPVPGHLRDPETSTYRLAGTRHLVAEWPFGRPQPRSCWITNMRVSQLSWVVSAAKLHQNSRRSLEHLERNFGLGDFEGRSFRGWHHHVTLVSAAQGFQTLTRSRAAQSPQLTGAWA